MTDRFLTIQDLAALTTLSKSVLWEMVRAGTFPQPRQLSERRKAWLESEVVRWMQERPVSEVSDAA